MDKTSGRYRVASFGGITIAGKAEEPIQLRQSNPPKPYDLGKQVDDDVSTNQSIKGMCLSGARNNEP